MTFYQNITLILFVYFSVTYLSFQFLYPIYLPKNKSINRYFFLLLTVLFIGALFAYGIYAFTNIFTPAPANDPTQTRESKFITFLQHSLYALAAWFLAVLTNKYYYPLYGFKSIYNPFSNKIMQKYGDSLFSYIWKPEACTMERPHQSDGIEYVENKGIIYRLMFFILSNVVGTISLHLSLVFGFVFYIMAKIASIVFSKLPIRLLPSIQNQINYTDVSFMKKILLRFAGYRVENLSSLFGLMKHVFCNMQFVGMDTMYLDVIQLKCIPFMTRLVPYIANLFLLLGIYGAPAAFFGGSRPFISLLIAVILIVLAFVGFLYYKNYKHMKSISSVRPFEFPEPPNVFLENIRGARGAGSGGIKLLGAIEEGVLYSRNWRTKGAKYYLIPYDSIDNPAFNAETEISLDKQRVLNMYQNTLIEENGNNAGKPEEIVREEKKKREWKMEKKSKVLDSILKKIEDSRENVKDISTTTNDVLVLQDNKEYRTAIHYLREWYYEQMG